MVVFLLCYNLEGIVECLECFIYILTTFTAIRQEIRDIEDGKMDKTNNPLKVGICPLEINVMKHEGRALKLF